MARQPLDDAELVAAALAGNREAFGTLYDRHAQMVRAVVLGVSRDWSASDDLIQESFLRGYRHLTKLREPAKFGHWIVGIARQVARERRRSLRRDRHTFLEPFSCVIESSPTMQPATHTREQLELVLQRLAELSERERIAIHAFFLDELEARHASAMMGLSRSGFYALVQRAVARLAARIRPCEIGEGRK
jgi:RNA polymerase sigma-70 factor (ECF subfamily)